MKKALSYLFLTIVISGLFLSRLCDAAPWPEAPLRLGESRRIDGIEKLNDCSRSDGIYFFVNRKEVRDITIAGIAASLVSRVHLDGSEAPWLELMRSGIVPQSPQPSLFSVVCTDGTRFPDVCLIGIGIERIVFQTVQDCHDGRSRILKSDLIQIIVLPSGREITPVEFQERSRETDCTQVSRKRYRIANVSFGVLGSLDRQRYEPESTGGYFFGLRKVVEGSANFGPGYGMVGSMEILSSSDRPAQRGFFLRFDSTRMDFSITTIVEDEQGRRETLNYDLYREQLSARIGVLIRGPINNTPHLVTAEFGIMGTRENYTLESNPYRPESTITNNLMGLCLGLRADLMMTSRSGLSIGLDSAIRFRSRTYTFDHIGTITSDSEPNLRITACYVVHFF